MKIAVCPSCQMMHEAVGPETLNGADEERRYRLTHCVLCEAPSELFHVRGREESELEHREVDYPPIVAMRSTEGTGVDDAAFVARGIRSLERARRTGNYIGADQVLVRLENKLASARARKTKGS